MASSNGSTEERSFGAGLPSREPAPLVGRFVALSLLVVVVSSTVLALTVGGVERRQAIGLGADLASRISTHLFRELEVRWLGEHPTARSPRTPAELEELQGLFRLHEESLRAVQFFWFDGDGLILYSTESELIGQRPGPGPSLRRALEGEMAVEMVEGGTPLHLLGKTFEQPLLEIYMPAPPDADPRLRQHVLEIYLDASPIERRVALAQRNTVLICLVVGGLLFVAVLGVVRRAQGQLEEQNRQLRELSAGLERRVERRTEELIRSRRLADVGTLAAGVAHEINNPLATISSCAEGLLDRLREQPGDEPCPREDFEDYLGVIRDETRRCKEITTALLDYSRTTAPRMEHHDLRTCIRDVETLIGPLVRSRGQRLVVQEPDRAVEAQVATEQIKQVLVNLLRNAVDASDGPQEVVLTTGVRNGLAFVSVRDGGGGLPAEVGQRIFEPFFTTKPPGRGVGMGLSVSRHIAELHGGRLQAHDNEDGPGATFVLELPVVSEPVEQPG